MQVIYSTRIEFFNIFIKANSRNGSGPALLMQFAMHELLGRHELACETDVLIYKVTWK